MNLRKSLGTVNRQTAIWLTDMAFAHSERAVSLLIKGIIKTNESLMNILYNVDVHQCSSHRLYT